MAEAVRDLRRECREMEIDLKGESEEEDPAKVVEAVQRVLLEDGKLEGDGKMGSVVSCQECKTKEFWWVLDYVRDERRRWELRKMECVQCKRVTARAL